MTSPSSTRHWLSIRIRILCVVILVGGSLLPPYVPKAALAPDDTEVTSQQFLLVEEGFLMKSSSLTQQGSRRAYAEGIIHTVKEGDSLQRLSERYGIGVDTIRWANKMDQNASIQPGQDLLILPVDGVVHTVSRGQTLSRIAELYDVPQEDIADQNKITSSFILAGQQLIIPGGKPIVQVAQAPTEKPTEKPSTKPVKETGPGEVKRPPVENTGEDTPGVLRMPCDNCTYTQYYHPGHYAVDIQTKGGGPIHASEGGTVIRADSGGWNGGYGNVIEIDHGNGLVTLYAHNKELYVKVGDTVERGDIIAWMGNTGLVYGKTGIHTHFEVILNGVKKNPLLYLQ